METVGSSRRDGRAQAVTNSRDFASQARDFYGGRKVFVTGGTGFVGSHLLRRLVRCGAHVRALARASSRPERLEDVAGQIDWAEGNLQAGRQAWARILEGREIVFHLAAAGVQADSDSDPRTLVETNVVSLGPLMYACKESETVQRVVVAGSCFEYGSFAAERLSSSHPFRPVTVYSISKLASTLLAVAYGAHLGIETVALRLFHVYGPGEPESRLVPTLILKALAGERVRLTKGEQIRDFSYVTDVADAFLRAAMAEMGDQKQRVLNWGSGEPVSVAEVARMVMDLIPENGGIELGALPYRQDEMCRLVPDAREAQEFLGWRAEHSLREGLLETIKVLRRAPVAGQRTRNL